ncbi:hypothetical protein HDU92_008066 [Lobulomyces angularis]|nr:hypothetical protein HDU92_008066 [Lobulomyces angularis]
MSSNLQNSSLLKLNSRNLENDDESLSVVIDHHFDVGQNHLTSKASLKSKTRSVYSRSSTLRSTKTSLARLKKDVQLLGALVSLPYSIAAFVLLLRRSLPDIPNFKLDIWIISHGKEVYGGKIVVPVLENSLFIELLSVINNQLNDVQLHDVNIYYSTLFLEWNEESDNKVNRYPLSLPNIDKNFLRFELSGFHENAKWKDVQIYSRKGAFANQTSESPLPAVKSHFYQICSQFEDAYPTIIDLLEVRDIEVLSREERELLHFEFSNLSSFDKVDLIDGKQPYLATIFAAVARRFPNRPALVIGDDVLTYAQLLKVSQTVAAILINDFGVRPNTTVALMLSRERATAFYSMLGVLFAGAAYVPIDDLKCPVDRAAFILEDAECKVAIVENQFKKELIGGKTAILSSDDMLDAICTTKRIFKEEMVKRSPGDAAYIIYTSGTTGKPKGVLVMQYNIANLILVENRMFGLNQYDRVYQNFSHSFDFSLEEIWMAYAAGAALVAPTQEMLIAGPDLPDLLEAAKITVLNLVPTHLSILARDVEGLVMICLGGEAAQENVIQRFRRPGRRIWNTYGPTEVTCSATYLEVSQPVEKMTIGKGIQNYSTYIVDPTSGVLLPNGGMGELILGGHGVASGYVGRPELTAEKFYPNPYPQAMPHWNNIARYPTNAVLYKTGDLVKFTPTGELEYFGRIDCQVKLRGFRVELGEIETVLCDCDNINTAIVHVWTDEDNGQTIQTLCAYVVLDDPSIVFSENEVKEKIAEKLATYMIPSIFVILSANEVPRLPSGKVNRKMLIKPEISLEENDEDFDGDIEEIQTDNKIQADIYLIWKKVFSSAVSVGLDSNFFKDLGGHSLLAARTISTMRENPALAKVGVKDLYKYPTIRSLAHFINPDNDNTVKVVIEDSDGMIKRFNNLPHRTPEQSYWICSLFQFLSFYPILLVASFPLLGGTLVPLELLDDVLPYFPETWPWEVAFFLLALVGYTGARIVQVLFCVLIKHIVMFGRYRTGIFPIYGSYYFRWWFVSNLMGTVKLADFHGTPLLNLFYKFFGCTIGKHVHIHSSTLDCMDLLTIEDGASICEGAIILGYEMKSGWIRFAKTHIGKNVTVGTHSVVSPGTILEDDSTLGDFSHAPIGSRIPQGETWSGSPATKVMDSRAELSEIYKVSGFKYFCYCVALFFGWIVMYIYNLLLIGPFFVTGYILIKFNPFALGWLWPIIIAFPASTL